MSGLFKRIRLLFNANLNELLDRMEDPEHMLNQAIREMEMAVEQGKDALIDALAAQQTLQQNLGSQQDMSLMWLKKAELALQDDNEYLARSTLQRKQEIDNLINRLQPTLEQSQIHSQELEKQLQLLQVRLFEAQQQRTTLLSRQRMAQAQKNMDTSLHKTSVGLDTQTRFDRMEDHVVALEARIAAQTHLNQQSKHLLTDWADYQATQSVEQDLAILRKKLKPTDY